jgi:hypothetical protein
MDEDSRRGDSQLKPEPKEHANFINRIWSWPVLAVFCHAIGDCSRRLMRWLVARSLLEALSLILLIAVVVQISQDYFGDRIVIDPIIVPKQFEEQGYTPQAFANQIRDRIDEIERSAMTKAKKEGLALAVSHGSLAGLDKETFGIVNLNPKINQAARWYATRP